LKIVQIVIDCADPEKLADFWIAATGYDRRGKVEQYAVISSSTKAGPALIFQKVPEEKTGKNRVHFDLLADSEAHMQEEIDRLTALGGHKKHLVKELGIMWTVMQDPEGNEFCISVH
jgi:hypothetical protein